MTLPAGRAWKAAFFLSLGAISASGCQGDVGPASGPEKGTEPGKVVASASTIESLAKPAATLEGDRLASLPSGPVVLSAQAEPSPFRFAEVAKESGVDFVHYSGMTDDHYFPTANGSGVAMFDYDGDGKLDLYFASATRLPLGTQMDGPNRLYKNLGGGRFREETEASGLGYRGFCHSPLAADIDNDGDQDLFLCNYGSNVLYLNNGNGTFQDISKTAGISGSRWSSSGAFLDYDNDGDLDLYVSAYGEWQYPRDDIFCGDKEKHIRLYCSPLMIRTIKHVLYRNNGDRTFTDVTDAAGVGRSDGRGFGVVTADLNDDGKIDIYVANDMTPNFLFLNKGDGTFEDATETSGAAFDERGKAQSGMGVDAEDVNGDGLLDLFVTNFTNEYNTLYLAVGNGNYMDASPYFGLASDTLPFVSWGCALADFDNDGWPDNFVTNGQVDTNRLQIGQNLPYEELPFLFANLKGKRFRLATRDAGPYFATPHVGRGAAFGDFDDDGDIDVAINHKDRPAGLLRNDSQNENRWIRLLLQGTKSNRDAIGARVEILADGLKLKRQRKGGCSMFATNDPRMLIGVGSAKVVQKVTVKWPSGAVSTLDQVETGRSHTIVEPAAEGR